MSDEKTLLEDNTGNDENKPVTDESQKEDPPVRTLFGVNPMKILFAMEYVLQGLANPFLGITNQSFFRHFRFDYGLSESVTQQYVSTSYLAWSFKPVVGFFMDAYGKTKATLICLLLLGTTLYLITPFFDISHKIFFALMFFLGFVFACTDVAVDRATVIEGEEEAKSSGRSKAAAVGLNQAICWAAVYGTGIIAAASGGWVAEHVHINTLLRLLALVPLAVLVVVLYLPRDRGATIPLKESVKNFWNGLNTGPILWVILFYFLFHFQPALGAIWLNHLIENLGFTQTQIGIGDGFTYFGHFLGVLIFAFAVIKWQDKMGLRNIFKIFIVLSIIVNLTQYLLVDPWFSKITGQLAGLFSGYTEAQVRLGYLSVYNLFFGALVGVIRMSTFSLVGAVIPSNAAGSLFAGFMSVANLAYSFSYSTGSWLYDKGLNYSLFRVLEFRLFGNTAQPGDTMSISLLIFIGSMAYLLSFFTIGMLPDRRETQMGDEASKEWIGPEHFLMLGKGFLFNVNIISILAGIALLCFTFFIWQLDIIKSLLIAFFVITFLRKVFLDWQYKSHIRET